MLSTENFTPSRINITAVHVDIAAEIIKLKKRMNIKLKCR